MFELTLEWVSVHSKADTLISVFYTFCSCDYKQLVLSWCSNMGLNLGKDKKGPIVCMFCQDACVFLWTRIDIDYYQLSVVCDGQTTIELRVMEYFHQSSLLWEKTVMSSNVNVKGLFCVTRLHLNSEGKNSVNKSLGF